MNILIVGFTKIKYMPYLNFYYENLDKKRNKIDLICWNRDGKEEENNLNFNKLYCFDSLMDDEISKIKKISHFIKFRSFVKKVLRDNKYDFVIILHSLPGILIFKYLKKGFYNKYILDYRDSTFEFFPPFKKALVKLCSSSKYTFVSSDGFRKFFPKKYNNKIYTSHNLLIDSLKNKDCRIINYISSDKIRISFWGFIRHFDVNLALIERISKDDRFELHYYGREQETAFRLKEYVEKNKIKNVFFHGEYNPQDRYEFARKTDLISNIYDNKNTNIMLCMGNKYYDGIIFKIPQLFMKNSYMGNRGVNKGIGLECDPSDINFCEYVYNYYKSLDNSKFLLNCEDDLEVILEEYDKGTKLISSL